MTGLDRILEEIRAEAETKAAQLIQDAEENAAAVRTAAEKAAAEEAAAVREDGKKKAEDLLHKALSAAELSRRRTILQAKQNAIRETLLEAKNRLHNLPDAEYFDVLLKLVARNALSGEGELQLCAKDLARMPDDFAARLSAATPNQITISKTPCAIADGFLLIYGGIDVNCTFDSLFESEKDALEDLTGQILFGA